MIYRIRWEHRYKKQCECCTEEQHPWEPHAEPISGPVDPDILRRRLRRLEDSYENSEIEIRNVVIERAEAIWVKVDV